MGMFRVGRCPSFTIKHPGVRKRVVSLAPSETAILVRALAPHTSSRVDRRPRLAKHFSRRFRRALDPSPSVRRTRAPRSVRRRRAAASRPSARRFSRPSGRARAETVHARQSRQTTRDDGFLVGDERHVRRRAERRPRAARARATPNPRPAAGRTAPPREGVAAARRSSASRRSGARRRRATSDASDPSPPTFPPTGARPNTACLSPPPPTPARPRPRGSRDRRPIGERRWRFVAAGATRPSASATSLRALDAPMTTRERLRAVMSLPPNEQILALVSGLDRDPEAPPWTGDDLVGLAPRPRTMRRRAVAALEDRMRRSLAATVARENARSMSPAWNEAIFSQACSVARG